MTTRRNYRYLAVITLVFCLMGGLVGCRGAPPSSEQVVHHLQAAIKEAQRQLDELTPNGREVHAAAARELEKMYAFEYRIVALNPEIPAAELESVLNELGRERWECSPGGASQEGFRFICKRLPLSYLKLLSQLSGML